MKTVPVVLLTVIFWVLTIILSSSGVYACEDTDPGGAGALKLQGYSFVEDSDLAEALAPWIAVCNCAEVLTILLENDFEINNVSGIQGPPGVVYTLVRGRPDRAKDTPADPPLPGVAVVKCGKAGPCGGDDGGCETTH